MCVCVCVSLSTPVRVERLGVVALPACVEELQLPWWRQLQLGVAGFWDSRPSPLGMGIMLESDSDIIPLIMPLLFRLFHLLLKKGRLFFRDR
jgi:hypothetical protein